MGRVVSGEKLLLVADGAGGPADRLRAGYLALVRSLGTQHAPARVTLAAPSRGDLRRIDVDEALLSLAVDRLAEHVARPRGAAAAAPTSVGRGCAHCHLLDLCLEGRAHLGVAALGVASAIGALVASGAPTPAHRRRHEPERRQRSDPRRARRPARRQLPFADTADFDDARRGLVAPLPDGGVITNADGGIVWDVGQYDWVNQGDCPDTVHPSLHRQTQLLTIHGLFEVCERVYQVRSADLANMTIIEGDTGVVLVDPLTSPETARAALELYHGAPWRRPVHAVIHTHSHVDHFGGVKGVTSDEDVAAGRDPDHRSGRLRRGGAVRERPGRQRDDPPSQLHVRPAAAQGADRERSARVSVWASRSAATTFMVPTVEITDDVQTMVIDGVEFTFMLAPGHRGPGGDAVPPAAVPRPVLGRGRHPRAAQPLHAARRPDP